jgi:hypothetical protein
LGPPLAEHETPATPFGRWLPPYPVPEREGRVEGLGCRSCRRSRTAPRTPGRSSRSPSRRAGS